MHRRYEILLPLRFNDGSAVPEHLVIDTLLELRQQFGAVSSETQIIQGQWLHAGILHPDELMRLFVDWLIARKTASSSFGSRTV